MASLTTTLDVAKFEAKSSGLITRDRAIALLEALTALETDFRLLKQRNAMNPGTQLKATYDECVSQSKAQPGLRDFGVVN
jgi:hypothetical protein